MREYKLAELLNYRKDYRAQLNNLYNRIRQNLVVQEGESPVENPEHLLVDYRTTFEIVRILDLTIHEQNVYNMITVRDLPINLNFFLPNNGETTISIADALVYRDRAQFYARAMKDLADDLAANQKPARFTRTEIKLETTMSIGALRGPADRAAQFVRLIDGLIQEKNWTTTVALNELNIEL